MGVPGLWAQLVASSSVVSLTALALEGLGTPRRGFRVGIDVSIWLFHAEYGKEGENPHLRTIFFRCAQLLRAPLLPLFVFDGKERPAVKRNKVIDKAPHSLVAGIQNLLDAFGFHWVTAPGEAEAELAYLNAAGFIDGIWSDDVDTFLFGATTVIRNLSNNLTGNASNPILNAEGRDDKNHVRRFSSSALPFTRADLILIALLRGGDYSTEGLDHCGMKTAVAMCKCGFGHSLFDAYTTLPPNEFESSFLPNWRNQLIEELKTDSQGHVGRKMKALANSIPYTFPDLHILRAYVHPITSLSFGKKEGIRSLHYAKMTFDRDPSFPAIAQIAEFYFEWGYLDKIIHRYKTLMWWGYLMRILRRQIVLNKKDCLTENVSQGFIRQYFTSTSRLLANITASIPPKAIEDMSNMPPLLGPKILRHRSHASTDFALEYRVAIQPPLLIALTKEGIFGMRDPQESNVWSDLDNDEDSGEDEREKKKTKKKKDELLVWIPSEILQLAEPLLVDRYETQRREKAEKKLKPKGTRPRKAASNDKKAKGSKESEAKRQSDNPWLSDVDSPILTPVKRTKKVKASISKPSQSTPKSSPMSLPDEEPPFFRNSPSARKEMRKNTNNCVQRDGELSDSSNSLSFSSPSKYDVPPPSPSPSPLKIRQLKSKESHRIPSDEEGGIKSTFGEKPPPKSPKKSKQQRSPHDRRRDESPSPTRHVSTRKQTTIRDFMHPLMKVNASSSATTSKGAIHSLW